MRNAVVNFAFTAAAILLFADRSSAQDSDWPEQPLEGALCSQYAQYWTTVAELARERGCSPGSDDEWSTNYNEQVKLCTDGGYDRVMILIGERNQKMKRVTAGNCGACAAVVDLDAYYAAGNKLYQCNFSANDYRWDTDRETQVGVCLGQFNGNDVPSVRQQYVNLIAEMRAQMDECKRTHQPKGCLFAGCHSSNSSAGVVSMPKSGNALRDSLEQLPRRAKQKVIKVDDPCSPGARSFNSPCKPSSSKVIDPGILEGGNDLSRQGPGAIGTPNAPATPPVYNRVR